MKNVQSSCHRPVSTHVCRESSNLPGHQ